MRESFWFLIDAPQSSAERVLPDFKGGATSAPLGKNLSGKTEPDSSDRINKRNNAYTMGRWTSG